MHDNDEDDFKRDKWGKPRERNMRQFFEDGESRFRVMMSDRQDGSVPTIEEVLKELAKSKAAYLFLREFARGALAARRRVVEDRELEKNRIEHNLLQLTEEFLK